MVDTSKPKENPPKEDAPKEDATTPDEPSTKPIDNQEWIVYREPYQNDKGITMYNEHRVKAEEYDATAKENGW